MATIRVATISYEHHNVDVTARAKRSIGQEIDRLIQESARLGELLYEVTFAIEESEAKKLINDYNISNPIPAEMPDTSKIAR